MPASAAMQTLLTFVISLLPIATYCWVLAALNRRPRPMLIHGSWDFLGVLLAASGILLWTGPILLNTLYRRSVHFNPGEPAPQSFDELWLRWWLIWAAYYVVIIAGSGFLLWLRSDKSAVYNVDPDLLMQALGRALQHQGLQFAQNDQQQFLFAPARDVSSNGTEATPPRWSAGVDVRAFFPLCNATLHWHGVEPGLRREIEKELRQQLVSAAPADNPAVLWLTAGCIVLSAAIFLAIVMFIIADMLPRRL